MMIDGSSYDDADNLDMENWNADLNMIIWISRAAAGVHMGLSSNPVES